MPRRPGEVSRGARESRRATSSSTSSLSCSVGGCLLVLAAVVPVVGGKRSLTFCSVSGVLGAGLEEVTAERARPSSPPAASVCTLAARWRSFVVAVLVAGVRARRPQADPQIASHCPPHSQGSLSSSSSAFVVPGPPCESKRASKSRKAFHSFSAPSGPSRSQAAASTSSTLALAVSTAPRNLSETWTTVVWLLCKAVVHDRRCHHSGL